MEREKYKKLSDEEKKKLVLKQKEWFNRQTKKEQDEMREKAKSILKIRITIIQSWLKAVKKFFLKIR